MPETDPLDSLRGIAEAASGPVNVRDHGWTTDPRVDNAPVLRAALSKATERREQFVATFDPMLVLALLDVVKAGREAHELVTFLLKGSNHADEPALKALGAALSNLARHLEEREAAK